MLVIRLGLLVIGLVSCFVIIHSAAADPQYGKVSITVSYTNDTATSYMILAEIHQKYTISQRYVWTDNTSGRFSLVSYSVDNGSIVPITRHHDGNFTLELATDSDHKITFFTRQQFEITSTETNMTFLPVSPTDDNWFDMDSDTRFIVPYVIPSDKQTRYQFIGWSADNSDTNIITRQESGFFKSPVIHMSENHKVSPEYKTQYYVNVISDFGRALGTGWYDTGAIIDISVMPGDDTITKHVFTGWQGQVIGDGKQYTANIVVNSPKILVANWFIDYTNLSIIAIIVISVLVLLVIYQKRKTPAKI